jgi:ABC-type multidrug transport system fused ATPase/permease subunit
VAFGLLDQALALASAGIGAYVVGRAATGASAADLQPWLIALGVLVAPRAVAGWLESFLAHALAYRCLVDLRALCYAAFQRLTPGYMLKRRSGDVGATVLADVEQLELFFAHTLSPLLVAVVVPLGALSVLAAIHWELALALAPALLLVATVPAWLRKRAYAQGVTVRDRLGALNADVVDSVQGLREVVTFGQQAHQLDRLSGCTGRLAEAHRAYARRSGSERAVTDTLMAIGLLLVLLTAANLVADGELSRPLFPVAVVLAAYAFVPLVALGETLHQLGVVAAAGQRILVFLSEPVPVIERAAAAPPPEDFELRIRFEGVTFSYGPDLSDAVSDVTFEVPAGQTAALVGHSGAGKSTCANLLLRWWDPGAGRVLIGDHDVADLPLSTLPNLIAFVPQDTYLFNCSVRENIRMARPDATDAEVEAAARGGLAHEFITDALPDGYDTMVGERGARISGGQRQRIAIARALLADAPVLVLDEAVSNLDAESEAALDTAMARASTGRTTLVIAHRRSTIRRADKVVMLRAGSVVDAGTDAELTQRCTAYRQLMSGDDGGHNGQGRAIDETTD